MEIKQPNSDEIQQALRAAVSAIYFNDGSDYEKALYEIIGKLAGEEFQNLTFNDSSKAFKMLNPDSNLS